MGLEAIAWNSLQVRPAVKVSVDVGEDENILGIFLH